MSLQTTYRVLLAGLLAGLLVLFLFPWDHTYSELTIASLAWVGADALFTRGFIAGWSMLMTLAYVIAYAGMFFYKRWARALLTALAVIGGFAIAGFGLSVQSGLESMSGYFLTLGDGAVLALAYGSDLRARFLKG